jgi:hypothetical protein
MSTCRMEDHLSIHYKIEPGLSVKSSYCVKIIALYFLTNFLSGWSFKPVSLLCDILCFFNPCN